MASNSVKHSIVKDLSTRSRKFIIQFMLQIFFKFIIFPWPLSQGKHNTCTLVYVYTLREGRQDSHNSLWPLPWPRCGWAGWGRNVRAGVPLYHRCVTGSLLNLSTVYIPQWQCCGTSCKGRGPYSPWTWYNKALYPLYLALDFGTRANVVVL